MKLLVGLYGLIDIWKVALKLLYKFPELPIILILWISINLLILFHLHYAATWKGTMSLADVETALENIHDLFFIIDLDPLNLSEIKLYTDCD